MVGEAVVPAILEVIKRRLLWVFAAFAVAGLAILLLPTSWSAELARFRSETGGIILGGTILAAALFLAGTADLLLHRFAARPGRALKLIPLQQKSWWHRARQQDGRHTAQIVVEVSIFNESKNPVRLAELRLLSPRVGSDDVEANFTLPHPNGAIHSSGHPVLPGRKVEANFHFMIGRDVGHEGRPLAVKLVAIDQHGSEYRLNLRVRSR